LGQVGASRGKLGQAGESRGRFGQVRASLNLHNAALAFLSPLCLMFTIYVSGTNCVNDSDVQNEQKG